MAALRQRHNKFEAKVRVPKALRASLGNREYIYRTLNSTNRRAAKLEAAEWETGLKLEWAQVLGHEKGFTYGRYNADGITLDQKKLIIELIDYPGVNLPEPEKKSSARAD